MKNLKFKQIKDAQYKHTYFWWLADILVEMGWNCESRRGNGIELTKGDLKFSLSELSDDYLFIWVTKGFEDILRGVHLNKDTTTQGILNVLDHYSKMTNHEIKFYNLLTPWQDQFAYKNIIRKS